MPRLTDGDARSSPQEDARLTELITALSALQEPARIVQRSISSVLIRGSGRLGPDVRGNLEDIAESCGSLGPATTRAIRQLVSVLGHGADHIGS